MWSQLFLCALVGFAAASNPAWQSNKEYTYRVHGRTLTGLPDVANQFSGIVMKANFIVRPESDGKLMARIADAKYSPIHTYLEHGWKSEIPENKVQYQQLPLTQKPFEIEMKNGVVRDVIVSKDVHTWEANIIKAFVSQIQLDLQAENLVSSPVNQLPEDDETSAVYKTMEETVSGKYATLYDIAPLPEYVLQSQPWLVPMPQIKGDGEFIEVVKSKNFSQGGERLGYYYGLGSMGRFEPNTNHMGDFFLRSAMSRAVVTGTFKKFTIQSSVTTNKIMMSPTLNNEQKGMVVSHLNFTLADIKQASGSFEQLQNPQKLGSLTYTFNTPFAGQESRHGAKQHRQHKSLYDAEERQHYRQRRSYNSVESESVESNEEWAQDEAQMHQPPQSPLLPFYIGYKGKSIKHADKIDVVRVAQKLAQGIASEIEKPEEIFKEQSLAKFVILSSVARIMSQKEMEQVAQQLYTKETQGQKAQAWYVYRDAIAECGTGPALVTVQSWIKEKKIRYEEAAEVIAAVAKSARQPTEEYMRSFYQFVTKEEQVQSQAILNDTAILSYTTLARKVYVDRYVSHNQFPVHAFGKFRTEAGKQFIVQDLIPYLKQNLNRAVEEGDSHKVLVYIRALGNVAHKRILAVFEPYLEGDKQVSQFQRFQMVLAFDKLVKTYPKEARSVLFKIYQNAGDTQEVRAAAVFQIMRTCPPASMLQRMAQYTNVDTHEQVNSAVKSAIESAAELEGEEFAELAENARAAVPLLTKETYGAQYSSDYLSSYVQHEMNLFYKQTIQTYGSQDSIFPKGIKYALRAGLGGATRQLFIAQYMVSSVDALTNVFERQTAKFEHNQQQQQQHYDDAQQNEFSSESIAKILNMKNDEREQLEGSALFHIGGGIARFFTFNNRTLQLLPSIIREVEQSLSKGQEFQYTKYLNRLEATVSFPTAMGFPFIYTLDAPTLLHFQGQVRASAEPKFSSGGKLHKPQHITAAAEVNALFSTKLQAKLGFITPFDHQQYTSGYDKNIQVYVPIKSQFEIDVQKQQMKCQLQAIKPEKNAQVFHYSSWPYTARQDILDLEPVANGPHTKVIYANEEPQTQFNAVVGKSTGMAFNVQYVSEQRFFDARWIYEQMSRQDFTSAFLAPLYDETIQHTKLNVYYSASQSSARKVHFRFGFDKSYEQGENNGPNAQIEQFSQLPMESVARQHQFAKYAAAGISDAHVCVCDMEVEFEGQNKVQYIATAALANSQVDPKGRALFYMKKESADQHHSKPFQFGFIGKTHSPKTNGLDFLYALKFEPTTTAQLEFAFGHDLQQAPGKINLHAKLEQSETRRRYLKNHPRADECRQEMQEQNQQLPACANLTQEANLLDRVHVKLGFENMSPVARNITHKFYNLASYLGFYNLEENFVNPQVDGKENEIEFIARFEPDFEAVNVTLKHPKLVSHFDNIRLNTYAKQVFAVHPVFPAYTRVMSEVFDYDTYRPFCVVDVNAANTLDNKTYPINLGQAYHVMFQYVPTFARKHQHQQQYQQQQKELQTEQHVILVRDTKSSDEEKEVKMTVRAPQSQGKLIEIDLKPVQGKCSGSSPCAQIFVNEKSVQFNDQHAYNFENGYIQIFGLPNGEVLVSVDNSYFIIYDGERVKLTVVHDKFRGAVRGLCGTFTGEQSDDFLTPKNCILRNPHEFAATYAVEEKGHVQQYKAHAQNSACYYQRVTYANVVSNLDAGRAQQHHHKNSHNSNGNSGDSCTKHQTRYVIEEDENQICFTIRPLPVCKSSCSSGKRVEKTVPVHCVQRTNVTELWKKQIQKGASPDFSQKSATKHLPIEVPESCSNY